MKNEKQTNEELLVEIERLRIIEDSAVKCIDCESWNTDEFYDLMIKLQDALRGKS